MGLPARLLELENPMEERVARLEVKVDHIQSDVTDLKVTVRRLDEKIDGVEQRLTAKIDAVDEKLTAKIDAVDQKLTGKIDAVDQKLTSKIDAILEKITGLQVGRALDRVWWLLMSAALLGIMARAFKWI
jgi:predicted  nucleic acid-binding Zn-ribbon protein